MTKSCFKKLALGLLLITFFIPASSYARLDILPRKVIIEPRERSGEVTILNVFDKPGLYRLKAIHYRQDEEGKYQKLEEPLSPDFDPAKHIRISPRQFEIKPKGRQKIRISARRPKDLPDGEYRFHLAAMRYDTASQEDDEELSGNVAVQISMNLGISIPVIIRHGDVHVSAKIENASYIPPEQATASKTYGEVNVNLTRKGNKSATGRLSIMHNGEEIGTSANLNIFTEVETRNALVPMTKDPRGLGKLQIIYTSDDGEIYDESSAQF
ncbi:MAG: hypothetical protein ACRBCT_02355 [Alphaproteobacteria bacterium]